MTPTTCTAPNLNVLVNGYNQINSPSGFQYDAAGNMTNDGTHSYVYDDEGRVTAVDGGATATTETKNAVKVSTGSMALGEVRRKGLCRPTASR